MVSILHAFLVGWLKLCPLTASVNYLEKHQCFEHVSLNYFEVLEFSFANWEKSAGAISNLTMLGWWYSFWLWEKNILFNNFVQRCNTVVQNSLENFAIFGDKQIIISKFEQILFPANFSIDKYRWALLKLLTKISAVMH